MDDYGIDAQIEVTNQEYPTGKMIAVQIKSGASYFLSTTEDGIIFRFDEKHKKYWLGHILPVIVLLYHPVSQECIWEVIDKFTVEAEGGIRSANYKTCFSESKSKGCNTYRQIFWYTDSDKRDYEKFYEIEHSRCYTEYGLKRTGCVGCPFSKHINEELAVIEKHEPDLYKAAMHIFGKSYEYTAKYREFQKMMKSKEKEERL